MFDGAATRSRLGPWTFSPLPRHWPGHGHSWLASSQASGQCWDGNRPCRNSCRYQHGAASPVSCATLSASPAGSWWWKPTPLMWRYPLHVAQRKGPVPSGPSRRKGPASGCARTNASGLSRTVGTRGPKRLIRGPANRFVSQARSQPGWKLWRPFCRNDLPWPGEWPGCAEGRAVVSCASGACRNGAARRVAFMPPRWSMPMTWP